ncbi:MAG: hypothetical protein U0350_35295 [Caldilineaceae bacterium]
MSSPSASKISNQAFWQAIDQLVAASTIVIDRPKNSPHPRFPEIIYPFDYGYLDGTVSGDGQGIDVWLGSEQTQRATAVICTVDLWKRDMEIKLLLGCNAAEIEMIWAFLNNNYQHAVVLQVRHD